MNQQTYKQILINPIYVLANVLQGCVHAWRSYIWISAYAGWFFIALLNTKKALNLNIHADQAKRVQSFLPFEVVPFSLQ